MSDNFGISVTTPACMHGVPFFMTCQACLRFLPGANELPVWPAPSPWTETRVAAALAYLDCIAACLVVMAPPTAGQHQTRLESARKLRDGR